MDAGSRSCVNWLLPAEDQWRWICISLQPQFLPDRFHITWEGQIVPVHSFSCFHPSPPQSLHSFCMIFYNVEMGSESSDVPFYSFYFFLKNQQYLSSGWFLLSYQTPHYMLTGFCLTIVKWLIRSFFTWVSSYWFGPGNFASSPGQCTNRWDRSSVLFYACSYFPPFYTLNLSVSFYTSSSSRGLLLNFPNEWDNLKSGLRLSRLQQQQLWMM